MFLIILRKGVIEDVMDFIVFRKFFVIRFFVNVFVVFSFVWIEIIIVRFDNMEIRFNEIKYEIYWG